MRRHSESWQQEFPEWQKCQWEPLSLNLAIVFFHPFMSTGIVVVSFLYPSTEIWKFGKMWVDRRRRRRRTYDHLHLHRHLLLLLPLRPFLPITSSHQEQGGKKVHTVLWLNNELLGRWKHIIQLLLLSFLLFSSRMENYGKKDWRSMVSGPNYFYPLWYPDTPSPTSPWSVWPNVPGPGTPVESLLDKWTIHQNDVSFP